MSTRQAGPSKGATRDRKAAGPTQAWRTAGAPERGPGMPRGWGHVARAMVLGGGLAAVPVMEGCNLIVGIEDFGEEVTGAGGSSGSGAGTTVTTTCPDVSGCTPVNDDFCTLADVIIQYKADIGFEGACILRHVGQSLKFARAPGTSCILRGGTAPNEPDATNPIEAEIMKQTDAAAGWDMSTRGDFELSMVPDGCPISFYCEGDSQGGVIFPSKTCE